MAITIIIIIILFVVVVVAIVLVTAVFVVVLLVVGERGGLGQGAARRLKSGKTSVVSPMNMKHKGSSRFYTHDLESF